MPSYLPIASFEHLENAIISMTSLHREIIRIHLQDDVNVR